MTSDQLYEFHEQMLQYQAEINYAWVKQQPTTPRIMDDMPMRYRCGVVNCKAILVENANYCHVCGQRVARY